MLVKDKDILVEAVNEDSATPQKTRKPKIKKEHMKEAWGDAFDTYLRGISENYIKFRGRSTRLEFWGYAAAAGIVWIPLYLLASYAEMPELSLYYALLTLPPAVAISARRLHDINKNALVYLLPLFLLAASGFFIGMTGAVALMALWGGVLTYLFSKPTDEQTGFYGEPKENDEIFEEDNERIIKKLRFIGIFLLLAWMGLFFVKFDDWSRQASLKAQNDEIMEKVADFGQAAGLSPVLVEKAQKLMKDELRKNTGKAVSYDDLDKMIAGAVDAIKMTQPK